MDKASMMEIMRKFHAAEEHKPGFRPEAPYCTSYSEVAEIVSEHPDTEKAWEVAEVYRSEFEKKNHAPCIPENVFIPQKNDCEYTLLTQGKPRGDESEYLLQPTRGLETLKGYGKSERTKLDRWGGLLDVTYEKTGFFHMELQKGRYIMVDPEGHPCYMVGISAVSPSMSPNALRNALEKFGSKESWAEVTVDRLRELGFVTTGMWSDNESLATADRPMGMCGTGYFAATYAERNRMTEPGVGHCTFKYNNTLPVFDPAFTEFSYAYAKEVVEPWVNDERIIGWFSDNELPTMLNYLERYLTLDAGNIDNLYSLTAAWNFLQHESGKENPSLDDVTLPMLEKFRGMVYARYFSVVHAALKAVDSNHLYLGCRFSYLGPDYREGTLLSESILRAAGQWCDVVSINYYFAWNPDSEIVENWIRWSGRPFMVSEWYAMSVNPEVKFITGAGFKVPGQKERARFYQNFALWLLECPWCAGFHWFMYMDNDPQDDNAEASNRNGNKGIVTTDFTEWTELTDSMQELNHQISSLIEWFDDRNKIHQK